MNLPVLALLADEVVVELPIPAPWYGIGFFVVLMLSLLVTLGFANKGRELPVDPNADH